jgi:transmembrane sensor
MISKEEQVRAAITDEASDWFVANDAGLLDARESAALLSWLRASPTHVEEFIGLAEIARDLPETLAHPDFSVETLLARARAEEQSLVRRFWSRVLAAVSEVPGYRWQTAAVTMAAFGAVTLGLLSWWSLRPVEPAPAAAAPTVLHFATRHGEQQTHRLADNSVLHLNTDTAVAVRYSKSERQVEIASGEADFEVAHEPERPFRVLAGGAEVIDLGTKFDVRLRNDLTVVTVIEGRVAVRPALLSARAATDPNRGQPLEFIELGADQEITVSKGDWPASPVTVDARRATAWLHRQIIFEREPLERVASEFNRYTPQPIEIITPKLRHLEITGVFSTDDSEEFLAFLRSLEGVKVDVTATRIEVSQK